MFQREPFDSCTNNREYMTVTESVSLTASVLNSSRLTAVDYQVKTMLWSLEYCRTMTSHLQGKMLEAGASGGHASAKHWFSW